MATVVQQCDVLDTAELALKDGEDAMFYPSKK